MIISPESYIDNLRSKSYKALIKERDKLIKDIRYFEKHIKEFMKQDLSVCPSLDVIYQYRLEYLGKLCELICEKFDTEYKQ